MLSRCFVASRAALPERRHSPGPHKPTNRTLPRSRSRSPESLQVDWCIGEETSLASLSEWTAPGQVDWCIGEETSRANLSEWTAPLPSLKKVHATRSCEDAVHRKSSTTVTGASAEFEQDKMHTVSLDGTTSTDSDIASADSLSSDESLTDCDEKYSKIRDESVAECEEKDLKIPAFIGKWKFSKFEGNFETMMADAGVSWTVRKMAKSGNYGIGLATQEITQNGSELTIQFHNGFVHPTMKLIVDGSEQETVGEDGASVIVAPSWKGQSLHIEGKTKQGRKIQETKRYLSGDCMVIETVTSGGEVISRYFSRI